MTSTEKRAIEPGQSWQVDLFRPEDAEGVADLFLAVYGEGYPIKTFIDPERLIAENAARRTISSVARTPKGDIIGHNALFQSAPSEKIYESGAGVVHRDYRGGRGVFTQVVAHGQDVVARKYAIETIFGEPVCNHVFSQRLTATLGWVTCAFEVDLMPGETYEKEKSASGRVAALLAFKPVIPKPHTVHLPAAYEEELRFIYGGLEDERELAVSKEPLPADGTTEIKTWVFDFAQVARLAVTRLGRDFGPVIEAEEKSVRDKGVVVIQVWLELTRPWVGQAVDELRRRGYFLGGALPRWFDGDGLLMQKILGRPNWEGIKLEFNRDKRLLELVKADWKRAVDRAAE